MYCSVVYAFIELDSQKLIHVQAMHLRIEHMHQSKRGHILYAFRLSHSR